MDEDLEENYEEEHPDSEKDLRFSGGHRDVPTEEEIEYELDFEEYPDDNKKALNYIYEDEDEFENKEFEADKFEEDDISKKDKSKRSDKLQEKKQVSKKEKATKKSKRKSIYNLDSYKSEATASKLKQEDSEDNDAISEKTSRYSHSMGISGIARLNLSPLTQKIIGCVIGENVTTEYPWIYIKKELIEDNIDLHDESSDFLDVKEEIESFPDTKILIGYAPSSTEDGQFYICLTEAGRDTVIHQIEFQRLDQENRVRNAVHKIAGDWIDLGSGIEVDETIVKNNRPLLEIEIELKPKLMRRRVILENRDVDDQRDGYIKLIPYRETFENVSKLLNDTAIQATPTFKDNEAQTVTKFQTNAWFQHSPEYSSIDLAKLPEDKSQSLKNFLEKYDNYISNEVLLNATWDIHTNDYDKLIRSKKDCETMMTVAYKEYANYYDGKLCMDRVINDLCWHPFSTGIAVCAYTDFAKSSKFIGPRRYNEVRKITAGNHKTLLWSFTDNLLPKLILDSPREVSAVSFCPFDGNLIIGGCSNGQIVLWHIPDLIEKLETVEVYTTSQLRHKALMKSLMSWMKGVRGSSDIEITATSALQSSQKARITQIAWVPCYNKIGKDGKIIRLPEDTSPSDLSCQFFTSSEDGTIAFWDLKLQTTVKGKPFNVKRDKSKISKPDILLQVISPYKELDGTWYPDYVIKINHPEIGRRLVITTMNIFFPQINKEQINHNPNEENNILFRKCFKPVIKKPSYEMEPKIFIGTATGHCGIVTWEGYNFSTGQMINRESCKWNWINIIHDGSITQAVRSQFITDLIMTVGGKIFALWNENFHRPFFWNRSKYSYTACAWGNYRPSVLVVSRSDGTIEIWNFTTKSTEPSLKQNLSGGILTGIYNHELPLNPQCIAFCDYNGALRLFLAPTVISDYEKDIRWMETFINRTLKGIHDFEEWQKHWSASNIESIEEKKKMSEMENKKRINEAAEENAKEMQETVSKTNNLTKIEQPVNFLEAARVRWVSMELTRMQSIILEEKGLKKKELERCRAPILKMKQEADAKKRKLRKIIQLQDKIFEDTAAFLFPKQYYEQHQRKVPATFVPEEKPPATWKLETSEEIQFNSPEEEIIYNFMEVQAEALSSMFRRPHKYAFQWRNTLSEGKARRNSMDVELQKFNKPKKGITGEGNYMSDVTQSLSSSTVFFSQESDQDTHD